MTKPEIVPATLTDFVAVYGRAPERSFEGFALRTRSHVAAVCGLYRDKGALVAFCQTVPPLPRRGAVQMCHRLLELMRSKRAQIFALKDETQPTADTLLAHLGFRFVGHTPDGGVYRWPG